MKAFAIVAVVCASFIVANALTDEQKVKAGEHTKACAVESGVTEDELKAAKNNPNLDTKDAKLQKFAKCFFTKSGFLDAKGDFDEKVVIEKLTADGTDKAKVEAFVKTCKKDLGDNKEENPLKVYACYVKNKAL